MEHEFAPKKLIYDTEMTQALLSGVEKVARAVGTTMGPGGNLVMYETPRGIYPIVTKDGVSVADTLVFSDPAENMGAQFVIQACNEQLRETGDGTTLTAVLAAALFRQAIKSKLPTRVDIEQVKEDTARVVSKLEALALTVKSLDELKQVARVAINHDNELGDAVASAVWKAGKYGMVTKEKRFAEGYEIQTYSGYKLDIGIQHPAFVNDGARMVLDNPYVLITDHRLNDPLKLANIVKKIQEKEGEHKRIHLAIIAPHLGIDVYKMMINNIQQNTNFFIVHIKPDKDLEPTKTRFIMEDLAAITNGRFISEESGQFIDKIGIEALGRCESIQAGARETFIHGKDNKESIFHRGVILNPLLDDVTMKDYAEESLAKMNGGLTVVKVGGKNFTDQNELNDRVDDCIRACKCAMEKGYIRGGGVELWNLSNSECRYPITREAFKSPLRKITSNAGIRVKPKHWLRGYSLATGESIDMLELGIADPVKVVASAVKNASNVVINMLRTSCMIINEKGAG